MAPQSEATISDVQRALIHLQQGNLVQAEILFKAILREHPQHFDALHLLGLVEAQRGHSQVAIELISQAIAINPRNASAYSNRGNALLDIGHYDEALTNFEEALRIECDFPDALNNRGIVLYELGRYEDALASYQRALEIRPDYLEALNNTRNLLKDLHRPNEALVIIERILAIKPDDVEAIIDLADTLITLGFPERALVCYERALAIRPHHTEALIHCGNALVNLKRHDDAIVLYARALSDEPNYPFLYGNWLHTKMSLCDWRELDKAFEALNVGVAAGKPLATPFTTLATPLPLPLQRRCAEMVIDSKFAAKRDSQVQRRGATRDRIRLGYFSGDFREQVVAYLTAGLFEMHDRNKFDLTAFSYGPPNDGKMRARIKAAFDHFIDVSEKSDSEIAHMARAREIDIAIDLTGFTGIGRPGIFAQRAAPIQVNYLGYPGTMGADYFDYLIADPTVIPAQHFSFYTEKIAHLPHTYLPNDSHRTIAGDQFTRQDVGLPKKGFVFCNLNDSFKITPGDFEVWMRLLTVVEGSVLWLTGANSVAMDNLRKEASARHVSPDRLIFKRRTPLLSDHLAQLSLADLFLDSYFFNAHTVANDALWAGLPVLTRLGETFAGRVAASLLKAVGLPELITHTPQAYEALAFELATDTPRLSAIRQRLLANRFTEPLFDTALFTHHIEAAYTAMWQRHQAELPPEHIVVLGA